MEAFQPCLTTIMFPWCQCKTWGWPLCCILEQLLHKKLHIQGLHYQKNQVRSWCCCMLERGVSENDLQILILPFLKLVRLEVGLPHFQTHQIKIQHLKLLQYPNIPSKILQYQLCIYIYISYIPIKIVANVAFYVPPLLDPEKNQANSKPQQVSCHLLHLQFHLRQHFSSCATLERSISWWREDKIGISMGSWISICWRVNLLFPKIGGLELVFPGRFDPYTDEILHGRSPQKSLGNKWDFRRKPSDSEKMETRRIQKKLLGDNTKN